MKKFKGWFILLGIVAVLLIPKFFCNQKGNAGPGMAAKGGPKAAVRVSAWVVNPEIVKPEYKVSGTLLANEQVELRTEIQGLVTRIYFKEGSVVKKGELLVKLNDAEFQAQLKKAMANRKLKEENARRNENLLKKEAISQSDYDLAVTELNSIEADIDFLKEQIRKTEIRAPFSGSIGLRKVSEGAYLTPATVITTLEDASRLKLSFSVPEKYAMKIQNGDVVHFTVSGSDKIFSGTLYARDASVSEDTRTISMKAICDNNSHTLLPGLFASVSLSLGVDKNSFMIPTQCIVPVLKGQKVYVIQGDSAIDRNVKTGFRSETKIEITEGLQAGDSLVMDGIVYMKPGVKVKVIKPQLK